MSEKKETDNIEGVGCLAIIAVIIIGIAIGNIWSAPIGWLALGITLLFVALVGAFT